MQIKIVPVLPAVALLLSCASAVERQSPCSAGETCVLEGVLELNSGGAGSAELHSNRCYDLALPREFYAKNLRWHEKQVVVSGRLLKRPVDANLLTIEIEGRKIEGGGCGQGVFYVTEIRRP